MTIRERFAALERLAVKDNWDGTYPEADDEGPLLRRSDVLELADELDEERKALNRATE